MSTGKESSYEFIKSIMVSVLIALLLRASVVEANKIPSSSMIPTLLIGDYILVNKLAYSLRVPFTKFSLLDYDTPERGRVVTFYYPLDEDRIFIKRVVGLPGDVVQVGGSKVTINGDQIPLYEGKLEGGFAKTYLGYALYNEQFGTRNHSIMINEQNPSPLSNYGPVTVPEGHIFVMGDNRDHSSDSRAWGFVPMENVLGTPIIIYYSSERSLGLFNGGIRWGRIGMPLYDL